MEERTARSATTAIQQRSMLNLFGLGRLRFAGSIASLMATALFATINLAKTEWIFLVHFAIFASLLSWCLFLLKRNKFEVLAAPGEVVADEFLGIYLALSLADPFSMSDIIFIFLIFRTLDLIKPPPFSWLEKALHRHHAVMAGDLAIGMVVGMLWFMLA